MEPKKLSKKEIKDALWERGNLQWKMTHAEFQGRTINHKVQLELYDIFKTAEKNSILVWLLSRQTGKTTALCILALEQCLQKPKSIVKIITDTKGHAESIVSTKIDELCLDCPSYLKPEYNKTKYVFTFPNGSQIQLAGSDGKHYEKLRGQVTDLVLIDEAGFCEDLVDMINGVLLPTTTHTGGKIVLASTPPKNPDHEFVRFIEKAELNGLLTKKTVYDNPLLSKEQIEHIIKQIGGVESEAFRREYLCEIIRSEDTTVIPEFNDKAMKELVRDDWVKPPFYDAYVGMDLGYDDLTAVLFGYYDFKNETVVIEDEIVIKGIDLNLQTFSKNILEKEESLWLNPLTNEIIRPSNRVSDINKIVTSEIYRHSGNILYFNMANKYDNETSINNLRIMIANKKIIIHPKCVTLIRHLRNCKWKKKSNERKFDRSPDDGHYDCVDALKYLIKSISYNKNPYPPGYDYNLIKGNSHIKNPNSMTGTSSSYVSIMKKLFNR